jgi:NADH-quinone oxidoreductase subunit G
MIEFQIDNQQVQGEQGETVIQVADRYGIYIPRFCYHEKLSIAANCRMCLVEVEKARKPMPACATPIGQDMKVFTRSGTALDAQRSVMEFLLINHPLDCPICDQGGECELQDLAMGYGAGYSRYTEGKRSVADENLGPLISTEMTRCIQCTRCVRFGDEVAGMPELGALNRGEDMEIGTYVGKMMQSELSGNVIDLCPVGALTNKPFRYSARPWEMQQHVSVAPHDCVGSNIAVHTTKQDYAPIRQIKRIVPYANEAINENWLADRDRYSVYAVHSDKRLANPMVKKNGQWQNVEWHTALQTVADSLTEISQHYGAEAIGGLTSPNATLEEQYLFQQLLRGIGSQNIDHRLKQQDFSEQMDQLTYPGLELPLTEIENQDVIVLIGSNIRLDQPLACHRVRKAWLKGAKVIAINPIAYRFNFHLQDQYIAGINDMLPVLGGIGKHLAAKVETSEPQFVKLFQNLTTNSDMQRIAQKISDGDKVTFLIGQQALAHPQAGAIKSATLLLAQLKQAYYGELTEGANTAGAWLCGVLPHKQAGGEPVQSPGMDAKTMFESPRKAYVLHGVEPELDSAFSDKACEALRHASQVVALTSYMTDGIRDYANVVLPVGAFTETPGTYINAEGKWQAFNAVTEPYGESRPAWKVLRVMGNFLACPGFDYTAVTDVREQLLAKVSPLVAYKRPQYSIDIVFDRYRSQGLTRIADWHFYRCDMTVRHSEPLQNTIHAESAYARVHPETANAHHLSHQSGHAVVVKQNNKTITLPLMVDESIPKEHLWLPPAFAVTAGFGQAAGPCEVANP